MSYDRSRDATLCVRCANLIVPEGAKHHWYYWLCHAWPLDPQWNAVTGQHDKSPPYDYCKGRNGGDCAKYIPGPNSLHPKATENGEVVEPTI